MIRVTVIALAKLKEKYLKEAVAEYEKRLSRYAKLDIIELEPVRLPENPSDAQIKDALEKEAQEILRKIPSGARSVAMCIEGKQMPSEEIARLLSDAEMSAGSIAFIIGSSYGLSEPLKKQCDMRLSVSPMTFPHQLFRVMLLEQIYRGFKINEGSAYHK